MRCLFIILLLFAAPVQAETLSIDEFFRLIGHLQTPVTNSAEDGFTLPQATSDLCQRLAEVSEITTASQQYLVDLYWINDVLEAMISESTASRRRLLFANLADTLKILAVELNAAELNSSITRQQMLAALERAMGKTSAIKVSAGAAQSSATSWCSGGAYVIDEPGEAVSIVHATTGAGSASFSRSGAGSSFSSAGSSGNSTMTVVNAGSSVWGGAKGGNNSGVSGSSSTGGSSTNASSGAASSNNASKAANQKNFQQSQKTNHQPDKPAPRINHSQKKLAPAPRAQPQPRPKPPAPPPPRPGSANTVFWIILVLSVIGFAILLYFMFRNLHQKVKAEQSQLQLSEKDLPPERLPTQTIYEKALQAAAEKNYAEAIRLLTIGALLMLEEHQVLNFQDAMTNGEYLRELMNRRQLHSLFAAPMALFDKLIYGFQNPDQSDFELFKEFYLNLEKQSR